MNYIRTPKDVVPFEGFLDRPEAAGFTTIISGRPEIYGPLKTGKDLNQFRSRRIQLSIHTWPPGKSHGQHHHKNWEQCYYIFSGQARITVDNEVQTVGPGSSAFMPPSIEHDIEVVGEEEQVAAVVTCVVDDVHLDRND